MPEALSESMELESGSTVEATTGESQTAQDGYESAAENPEILAAFERTFGNRSDSDKELEDEGDEPTVEAPGAKLEPESQEEQPKPAEKVIAPKPAGKSGDGKEALATLNPVLLQAARRAKMTDEQIGKLYASDPAFAEAHFTQLQGFFNDLSSRYAQSAVARQQITQNGPQQAPANPQTQPPAGLDALYNKLEAFAANNGQEIVDQLIKPLYAEVIAPFRQMQAAYQQQQRQAMASEIGNVFKGFGKEYGDLYGETGKQTNEQVQARFQVAQLADQIRAGANMQGIDMPVAEALDRAHGLFTAKNQAQFQRQAIAAQVKKRTGAISARPTQRREAATVGDGALKSDKAAMSAVEAFWAERGN